MIFSSIKTGIVQTFQARRMMLIFYFTNLVFGIIIMFPFRSMLNTFVGSTLMAEKLAGRIDMDFLFEFVLKNKEGISMLGGLITVAALVFVLAELFLSGGAFSIFVNEGKWDSKIFWAESAKYFARFFRLALWSIPVFVILYLAQFIENGFVRLVFGKEPYEYITFWGRAVRVGLGYIGILLSYVIFDYARIYAVMTNERKMRRAIWRGIKFTFGNFFKTFALALILFVTGIIILFIYNLLADALHTPNALVIFLLFLVQQVYMIFRITIKMLFYASQSNLYKTLTPGEIVTGPEQALTPALVRGQENTSIKI